MIIISILLLILAFLWLGIGAFGLSMLLGVYVDFQSIVAVIFIAGICFGVATAYFYVLWKLVKNKGEADISRVKELAGYMFWVALIWLSGDLIERSLVEIKRSLTYLIMNLMLWHLANRMMKQLPESVEEDEAYE